MAATSFLPAVLVSTFLGAVGVAREGTIPEFDPTFDPLILFVGIVLVSPILETLLMAIIIGGLSHAIHNRVRLAVASAVVWAVLHSIMAAAWGLVVLWPFFVFSCAYLAWGEKSRRRGLWVAASIHMLHNLLPAALLLAAV